MKIRSFIFFATMFFASFHSLNAQGFLHASGTKIVDGNGANYILKGMGLGGCMVQEPYMMLVSASAPAGQHSIFADIEALIGKEKLNTYVGPKHVCASACIYVLSSGIVRMAYGDVSVHRSSFNDEFPIEKIEKALVENDIEKMNYLYEMGMTTQLVEAIKVTPHWTRWTLDEKEKRRWGVHGTERIYEELWFRTTAKAKFYDTDVVRDFFFKHFEKCTKMAKEFKMTVFDCVKNEM